MANFNTPKFKHNRHTIDISDKNLVFVSSEKNLIVEASMLNHKRISSWRSSNLIWDMIKVYSPKSKKSYTFISGPGDTKKNPDGEIISWIFKCEYGEVKSELHILND